MCERKTDALAEELNRLKKDWMEQEREIEWLRKELDRTKGELKAIKERDSSAAMHGQSTYLSRQEREDFETLWACCGR